MLPLGVDTDLTTQIKSLVSDPLSHLLNTKNAIDHSIGSLISIVIKEFSKMNSNTIKKVALIDSGLPGELHFAFILKEDSETNRNRILEFLADYKSTRLWTDLPLFFQIVPPQIAGRVMAKELLFEN